MTTNYITAITDVLWQKIEKKQKKHGMALLTGNAMPYVAYGHASDADCKLSDANYCKRVWEFMSLPRGRKAGYAFICDQANTDSVYTYDFHPIHGGTRLMGVLVHQTERDERQYCQTELDTASAIITAILDTGGETK